MSRLSTEKKKALFYLDRLFIYGAIRQQLPDKYISDIKTLFLSIRNSISNDQYCEQITKLSINKLGNYQLSDKKPLYFNVRYEKSNYWTPNSYLDYECYAQVDKLLEEDRKELEQIIQTCTTNLSIPQDHTLPPRTSNDMYKLSFESGERELRQKELKKEVLDKLKLELIGNNRINNLKTPVNFELLSELISFNYFIHSGELLANEVLRHNYIDCVKDDHIDIIYVKANAIIKNKIQELNNIKVINKKQHLIPWSDVLVIDLCSPEILLKEYMNFFYKGILIANYWNKPENIDQLKNNPEDIDQLEKNISDCLIKRNEDINRQSITISTTKFESGEIGNKYPNSMLIAIPYGFKTIDFNALVKFSKKAYSHYSEGFENMSWAFSHNTKEYYVNSKLLINSQASILPLLSSMFLYELKGNDLFYKVEQKLRDHGFSYKKDTLQRLPKKKLLEKAFKKIERNMR